jgi:hypothetical protein
MNSSGVVILHLFISRAGLHNRLTTQNPAIEKLAEGKDRSALVETAPLPTVVLPSYRSA